MSSRETHRAVFSDYGGPDLLRLVELDAPQPGAGQVRIAVRAAGVNPIDWKLRGGMPIARSYPLTDAALAQRESEAGHVRGKLVLIP